MDIANKQRRRFFRYSLGSAVGLGLIGGGWWWQHRQSMMPAVLKHSGLGAEADAVLASLQGSSRIGEWVIAADARFKQPLAKLVQMLRQRLKLSEGQQPETADFTRALQQAVSEDFAQGHVLMVNGWQLSETEALVATIRWHVTGITSADRDDAPAEETQIAHVTNWGPQETHVGKLFNEQSGGYSVFWISGDDIPRWAQIAIDGTRLESSHRGHFMAATVRGKLQQELLAEPGEHVLTMHDDMARTWQTIGVFKVLPKPAEPEKVTQNICRVTNWGPRQGQPGEIPNRQPDGNMGMWIDTLCVPGKIQVRFGETLLNGHFNGHAVTVSIPAEHLQTPGNIPLALIDPGTQEVYPFGEFVIKP